MAAVQITRICTAVSLPELDQFDGHNGGSVRVLPDLTYHSA